MYAISFCKNQVTLPLVVKEGQRNKQIFAESDDSTFSEYFVPAIPLTFKEEGWLLQKLLQSRTTMGTFLSTKSNP